MNIMNFTNCNNKLISVSNTYTALKISTKINETNVLGVHFFAIFIPLRAPIFN